jgi:hypothetical protein
MNRNIIINNSKLDILEPTKNLYMVNDTILQNRINKNIVEQNTDINYGVSQLSANPDFGINAGHMSRDVLSKNPINIENELYGLHMLNGKYQVKKRKYGFTPRINKLNNVKFFEKQEVTYIPEPLVIEKNQRPIIP